MTNISFMGWIGALFFVVAYLLLSMNILSPKKSAYHVLNILGGLILSLYSFLIDDMPNFAVNLIWMCIAIYSTFSIIMIRLRLEKKTSDFAGQADNRFS